MKVPRKFVRGNKTIMATTIQQLTELTFPVALHVDLKVGNFDEREAELAWDPLP
jgi:hypothetical protein